MSPEPEAPQSGRWGSLPFVAACFASAFLIFLVQPMVGKRILPWFGGAPAVWTLCLAFYQTTLFAGYAYAHLVIRYVPPAFQLALHGLLLVGALFALPVLPVAAWTPAGARTRAARSSRCSASTSVFPSSRSPPPARSSRPGLHVVIPAALPIPCMPSPTPAPCWRCSAIRSCSSPTCRCPPRGSCGRPPSSSRGSACWPARAGRTRRAGCATQSRVTADGAPNPPGPAARGWRSGSCSPAARSS